MGDEDNLVSSEVYTTFVDGEVGHLAWPKDTSFSVAIGKEDEIHLPMKHDNVEFIPDNSSTSIYDGTPVNGQPHAQWYHVGRVFSAETFIFSNLTSFDNVKQYSSTVAPAPSVLVFENISGKDAMTSAIAYATRFTKTARDNGVPVKTVVFRRCSCWRIDIRTVLAPVLAFDNCSIYQINASVKTVIISRMPRMFSAVFDVSEKGRVFVASSGVAHIPHHESPNKQSCEISAHFKKNGSLTLLSGRDAAFSPWIDPDNDNLSKEINDFIEKKNPSRRGWMRPHFDVTVSGLQASVRVGGCALTSFTQDTPVTKASFIDCVFIGKTAVRATDLRLEKCKVSSSFPYSLNGGAVTLEKVAFHSPGSILADTFAMKQCISGSMQITLDSNYYRPTPIKCAMEDCFFLAGIPDPETGVVFNSNPATVCAMLKITPRGAIPYTTRLTNCYGMFSLSQNTILRRTGTWVIDRCFVGIISKLGVEKMSILDSIVLRIENVEATSIEWYRSRQDASDYLAYVSGIVTETLDVTGVDQQMVLNGIMSTKYTRIQAPVVSVCKIICNGDFFLDSAILLQVFDVISGKMTIKSKTDIKDPLYLDWCFIDDLCAVEDRSAVEARLCSFGEVQILAAKTAFFGGCTIKGIEASVTKWVQAIDSMLYSDGIFLINSTGFVLFENCNGPARTDGVHAPKIIVASKSRDGGASEELSDINTIPTDTAHRLEERTQISPVDIEYRYYTKAAPQEKDYEYLLPSFARHLPGEIVLSTTSFITYRRGEAATSVSEFVIDGNGIEDRAAGGD